jgi:hypothetical protein
MMSVSYSTHFVIILRIAGDFGKNNPELIYSFENFGTFLSTFRPIRNFVYFLTFSLYMISYVTSAVSLFLLKPSSGVTLLSGSLKIC